MLLQLTTYRLTQAHIFVPSASSWAEAEQACLRLEPVEPARESAEQKPDGPEYKLAGQKPELVEPAYKLAGLAYKPAEQMHMQIEPVDMNAETPGRD